jgi:hypothetical protein
MTTTGLSPGSFTTFGEMLRVMRRRAHLTQGELGIAVGYSGTFITRLEGNVRPPDPTTVRARFVDALRLQDEPELARRLIELAYVARQKSHAKHPVIGTSPDPANPDPTMNLPAHLTLFIGRSQELAAVTGLLATGRLVTLTGCGGAGKTRLALEVGAASLPAFPDGVHLVELASLADPGRVADAIVTALGLHPSNRPGLDVLIEQWRRRRALLLLDNCEHLIGACAELAEALLRACPGLHILATSRERLNLQGEIVWRVPSLATDEAVQLFAARARRATGLHPDARERRGGPVDLPAARRHPAGHRTGGRTPQRDVGRRAGAPVAGPLPDTHRGQPYDTDAPPHVTRGHRLELRPVVRT